MDFGNSPSTTTPNRDGQIGVQFSLFDISDPASPRRIDTQSYGGGSSGLVLLRANADGLSELGRLATTQAGGAVNRSLVIGDTVYMLSDGALQANSLHTHRKIDQLIF